MSRLKTDQEASIWSIAQSATEIVRRAERLRLEPTLDPRFRALILEQIANRQKEIAAEIPAALAEWKI
ncbi:MAG: hypothetical protein WCS65_16425 [Verrucomicrobiae bacterium]